MGAPSWHRSAYSVAAMRAQARRVLPRPIFDFADGGAENEYTLRRNEAAFGGVEILPRPLNGAAERDPSVTIFGQRLSLPFMIGPTGLSGLLSPGGELAASRAAAAAGTAFCLSHASTCTIEDLAASGMKSRWMQIFIYRDPGFTREFVERAQAADYDALVLTIDNQITGKRERDIRNGFVIPPHLTPWEIARMAVKLPWLLRMAGTLPRISLLNYAGLDRNANFRALAGKIGALIDSSISWNDVDLVRSWWKGPLILKGVLHPKEAAEAVAHGVDGVIVSNHGGRQIDGVPGSFDALPGVVAAVGGRIPVLLDGGIRRGNDVIKALALGASLCLIGRAHLYGLAVAGEEGVARVIDILRREIDMTMALMGVGKIADLGPDYLLRR